MIRIALAEDHVLVRQGITSLLGGYPDVRVVGETGDGRDVLRLVTETTPDVLLLDLMLPGMSGLEVAQQVTSRVPATRVLVLSMHADEGYVLQALRGGALGYMLKDSPADELVRAIREVAAGRRYLGAPLSDRAVAAYARGVEAARLDPLETLTPREREVLGLAAQGLGNTAIGHRLGISARTAEVHRAHIMRKLGLEDQAALLRLGLRHGLVPMD